MFYFSLLFIICIYYLFIYVWYIKPYQKALKRRNDQLETLSNVSLEFHSYYGLPETMPAILTRLMEVCGAEAASLFIFHPDKNAFILEYAGGAVPEKILGLNVPRGEGIVSRSVDEKRSIIVNDVAKEGAFYQKADEESGFSTKSMICVPLFIDREPVGAFEVINKKGGSQFDYEDLRLLETLANLTALAVRNTINFKKKS